MFLQISDYKLLKIDSITEITLTVGKSTIEVDGHKVALPYLDSVLTKLQVSYILGNQLAPMTRLKLWLRPDYGTVDFIRTKGVHLAREDFSISKGVIHIPLEGKLMAKYKIDPEGFNIFGIVPELQGDTLIYKES